MILKEYPNNKNYLISTEGNVINKKRNSELKNCDSGKGYKYVKLHYSSKPKNYLIHRLIAETFISNPENKTEINHKDGNKSNNTISNLEWCTKSENMKHSYDTLNRDKPKHLVGKFGGEHPTARKVIQLDKNTKQEVNRFNSIIEAHKLTGTTRSAINFNCQGKYKSAGGFVWRYNNE